MSGPSPLTAALNLELGLDDSQRELVREYLSLPSTSG